MGFEESYSVNQQVIKIEGVIVLQDLFISDVNFSDYLVHGFKILFGVAWLHVTSFGVFFLVNFPEVFGSGLAFCFRSRDGKCHLTLCNRNIVLLDVFGVWLQQCKYKLFTTRIICYEYVTRFL